MTHVKFNGHLHFKLVFLFSLWSCAKLYGWLWPVNFLHDLSNIRYPYLLNDGGFLFRTLIYNKIHHELNQFCSAHSLQEVYIERFGVLWFEYVALCVVDAMHESSTCCAANWQTRSTTTWRRRCRRTWRAWRPACSWSPCASRSPRSPSRSAATTRTCAPRQECPYTAYAHRPTHSHVRRMLPVPSYAWRFLRYFPTSSTCACRLLILVDSDRRGAHCTATCSLLAHVAAVHCTVV